MSLKTSFDSLQESLYQIRSLVREDAKIRRLVLYDQPSALSVVEDPALSAADDHIVVTAVFDITEEPYNLNTIITIALSRATDDEDYNMLMSVIRVNIITKAQLWALDNQKIRPLEIANLIIEKLENQKLAASNKIYFHSAELVVLDGNTNGYGLTFHLIEGSGLEDEF